MLEELQKRIWKARWDKHSPTVLDKIDKRVISSQIKNLISLNYYFFKIQERMI